MLKVETEARQIVENVHLEANDIRKKAREDAKQLVIDGKKELEARIQREIKQLEEDATAQKEHILKETEKQLAEMQQGAEERIETTVDQVVALLLKQ